MPPAQWALSHQETGKLGQKKAIGWASGTGLKPEELVGSQMISTL